MIKSLLLCIIKHKINFAVYNNWREVCHLAMCSFSITRPKIQAVGLCDIKGTT